jgi:hypothetical protein
MTRDFVLLEIRKAVQLQRKIVLIHETDVRFHAVNFSQEREQAPEDLKFLFDDVESIAWRRKGYEREAMLYEIARRAGDAYGEHFKRRAAREPRKNEMRMSTVSSHSLFFDEYRWFRTASTICTSTGCLWAAMTINDLLSNVRPN